MIIGHQGKVVGYLELRADEAAFENIDAQLSAETAVFRVGTNDDAVTLTLRDIKP